MLVKYATLWSFTLPLSSCDLHVLFTSHFGLIYSGLKMRPTLGTSRHVQCFGNAFM